MILIDTNILIDYWKTPDELIKLNVTPQKFAICGPVKTELLHGSKSEDETDKILGFLKSFHQIPIDEYDWEFIGIIMNNLRNCGFKLPVTDVLIAYTAMKHDIPVWTKDRHFKHIQSLYTELKLYEPS